MKNPMELPRRRNEDPNSKMSDEFVDFIGRHEYTADQMHEAYLRLWGVSERTDADLAITAILAEMERMKSAGFPEYQFVGLIDSLRSVEDAVPLYMQYIEGLPIPTTDKWKLRAIVRDKKSGVIQIDIGGQPSVTVSVTGREDDPELMATELVHAMKRIIGPAQVAGLSFKVTVTS